MTGEDAAECEAVGADMDGPMPEPAAVRAPPDPEDDEIEDDLYGPDGRPAADGPRAPDWTVQVVRAERSVFELCRQWKAGRLVLDPEFQRHFIWKPHQQVRLVESVLARIPLPAIYLSDESEVQSLVIDGQQRLTTLFRYLDNEFPLQGLQLLPGFEGMSFANLEARLQRRIEDTPLTVFSIQPGSDPQVKFYLFERLNQGGISLNAQEIRNGIYRGPGLDLVQRLGREGGPFRRVAGAHRRYARMKADELVLRALAFMERGLSAYPGDMAPFLNGALIEMNKRPTEYLANLESRFLAALETVEAVFGLTAFCRYDAGHPGRHLNAALMDVEMWGFEQVPHPHEFWVERKDAVRAALVALHGNPRFRDAITYATSMTSRVRHRLVTWKQTLEDVAANRRIGDDGFDF
ncbi:MAG: DUF262 domain-containing protein [Deltaproteobacteria bacterium]|nr:DUF262 domain-containing protein [Deltaproteobacteria bacterium]